MGASCAGSAAGWVWVLTMLADGSGSERNSSVRELGQSIQSGEEEGTIRRLSAATFDTVIVALSALLVFGGYLLVWADNRGLVAGNQLFSPWAIPLFAGFLVAAYLLLNWWGSRRGASGSGISFLGPLRYSLYGAALFIVGLLIEFILRATGGRTPAGAEGVLAPSRLLLFAATMLLLTGPILSIVGRRAKSSSASARWREGVPTLALALGLMLAVLTLLTSTFHPVVVMAGAQAAGADEEQTPADLYLVPLDGSGSRRLTTTPGDWEEHPDVSPDGRSVAFRRGSPDSFQLYTLDLGSGQIARVTHADQNEDGPVWAPDGRQLSYWSPVDLPSASPTPVGPGPAPAPSPGTQARASNRVGLGIWLVSPDNPDSARPWTGTQGEGIDSWSPAGDQYCGWAYQNGSFDIVTWQAATGVRTNVAAGTGDAWSCSWSPDGQSLAWHSDVGGSFDIYTSNVDGTHVTQLTSNEGVNQLPRWSPDGSQLAWISNRDGEFEIWVAAADGSAARNITNDPALDDGFYGIAWLPDGSGIIAASTGRVVPSQLSSESVPLGVGSIALQTLMLVGALMLALRLAPGTVGLATAVATVDALLMLLVTDTPALCLAIFATGLAVDVAVLWLARTRRGAAVGGAWLGVAAGVAFAAVYFAVLASIRGIGWDAELVLGAVMLAGLFGYAASLVVRPPTTNDLEVAE